MTKILLLTILLFINFQEISICQAEKSKRGNNASSATKPGEEQTSDIDTTEMIHSIIYYLADRDPKNPLTEEEKKKFLGYLDLFDLSKVPSAGLHLAAIYYWYDFKDTVMAEKYFLAGIQNRPDSILGLALDSYGDFLKEKKDYDSSIIVLKKSLDILLDQKDFKEAYETSLTLGNIFTEFKTDYKESLMSYLKCLDILNIVIPDPELRSENVNAKKYGELYAKIGLCYVGIGITDLGKEYLSKVLSLVDDEISDNIYLLLMMAYNIEQNRDSVIYCVDKILNSKALPEIKILSVFMKYGLAMNSKNYIEVNNIKEDVRLIDMNTTTLSNTNYLYYVSRAIKNYLIKHNDYKHYLNTSDSLASVNKQYDDLYTSLKYRSYLHYYDEEMDSAFIYLDSAITSMNSLLLEIIDSDVTTTMITSDANPLIYSIAEIGIINYERTHNSMYLKKIIDLSEVVTARSTLNQIRISKLKFDISNKELSKIDSIKTEISLLNNKIKSELNKNILTSLISKRNELYDNYNFTLNKNYSILYGSNLGEFRPVTLKMIQDEVLDYKTVVVRYFISRDSCYLISFDKSNLWHYKLPNIKELELNVKAIRNFYSHYTQNNSAEFYLLKNNAYKLYEYLLKPIAEKIKDKHLVIIPDNILYYLPFEILITDTSELKDFKHAEFLVKEHTISYSPSLSLLYYLNKMNKSDSNELLLVGKSNFSRGENKNEILASRNIVNELDNISDLPGVEMELSEIKSIFDDKYKVNIMLNKDAKEKDLKQRILKPYQLIHFATHGIVDDYGPQYCSLLLNEISSTNEEEDGYFQAFEISSLDIHSNLIVLSACNTALGKLYSGEGMKGLSQSFFIAGARSLCLTLWSISDFSTSEFMSNFYSGIDSGLPYINALQQAKIKFIESDKYNSPYYWAPYILSGATN